jgi:hypothetical protein
LSIQNDKKEAETIEIEVEEKVIVDEEIEDLLPKPIDLELLTLIPRSFLTWKTND